MRKLRGLLGGFGMAAAFALPVAWAADPAVTSALDSGDRSSPEAALAAYRVLADSQSRNYDRAQDISPRQMFLLLEVTERTGASLGQALATGEFESAHTWNDHVRPTLNNGNLGSATGVWQFMPGTFQSIVKKYGAQLLSAAEEDFETDREHLDLGDGPFPDAKVRGIIQETVGGKRGVKNEELQLLRHNFAVLAFAKHYLSLDSGATTAEEDYLFHFLGAKEGRRVLALARGKARNTLSVKPTEVPVAPLEDEPESSAGDGSMGAMEERALVDALFSTDAESALARPKARNGRPPKLLGRGREARRELPARGRIHAVIKAGDAPRAVPAVATRHLPVPDAPPLVSSEWGLPEDSSKVTGNLGMFYRDGKGQSQPYTWAEFVTNLARRVRAKKQPALVRAKYGVGFDLKGGDIPERAFNPKKARKTAEFLHEKERTVLVPEALVTGTLSREETRQYKQRLAALVAAGEDKPTDTLPPEALSALHHLRMLPPEVEEVGTANPEVRKALRKFRKKVGKAEPDAAEDSNLLMPAERIALEIYDRRLARYAELQACQKASMDNALDLSLVRKTLVGSQRAAAYHIAELQKALAEEGLLKQPTKKIVWRDKKRKRHVKYKRLPFAGKVGKKTVAALNSFQLRSGLRKTQGVLDAATLDMLGLPPVGWEILLPLSGPECAIEDRANAAPACKILTYNQRVLFGASSQPRTGSGARLLDRILATNCLGPRVGDAAPELEDTLETSSSP